MKIEIYTKNGVCQYCTSAKTLLQLKGLEYTERVVGVDATREELLERAPNAKTFPQIWIDEEHVGGFDALEKWFDKDK